ncbi:MAG: hypothetical protein N3E36_02180 [Sulfolobales archaeon]|nr:hypothetical protein [Sulfolobales archaeon]MCX8198821.1 hypothetical protein [Sulfolobales archaeon]MDW8170781.1 hypothetical protein [Desulfurococcaceae archaeon]
MVDVEISGILEERLRRLVDLGIYSSLSEAVRDAVRRLLDQMDLRNLALKLYTLSEASFQYIVEFADSSFDDMAEYFITKGYMPLIGLEGPDDVQLLTPGKKYILDPLTIYIVFKSNLYKHLAKLAQRGYVFLVPDSAKNWSEVLISRRMLHLLESRNLVEFFNSEVVNLGLNLAKAQLTKHEQYAIAYARDTHGATLITEDFRTRGYARSMGVNAVSSLSIIYTLRDSISVGELRELIYYLKSIPVIIPIELIKSIWGIDIV